MNNSIKAEYLSHGQNKLIGPCRQARVCVCVRERCVVCLCVCMCGGLCLWCVCIGSVFLCETQYVFMCKCVVCVCVRVLVCVFYMKVCVCKCDEYTYNIRYSSKDTCSIEVGHLCQRQNKISSILIHTDLMQTNLI